jgi:hypothetical protein
MRVRQRLPWPPIYKNIFNDHLMAKHRLPWAPNMKIKENLIITIITNHENH